MSIDRDICNGLDPKVEKIESNETNQNRFHSRFNISRPLLHNILDKLVTISLIEKKTGENRHGLQMYRLLKYMKYLR